MEINNTRKSGRNLLNDIREGAITEAVCFCTNPQLLDEFPTIREAMEKVCGDRNLNIVFDDRRFFTAGELIQAANKLKNNQVALILSHRMPEAHVLELGLSANPAIPFLHMQRDTNGHPDWMIFVDNSRREGEKVEGLWSREAQTAVRTKAA
jgi:hypothetical protein